MVLELVDEHWLCRRPCGFSLHPLYWNIFHKIHMGMAFLQCGSTCDASVFEQTWNKPGIGPCLIQKYQQPWPLASHSDLHKLVRKQWSLTLAQKAGRRLMVGSGWKMTIPFSSLETKTYLESEPEYHLKLLLFWIISHLANEKAD